VYGAVIFRASESIVGASTFRTYQSMLEKLAVLLCPKQALVINSKMTERRSIASKKLDTNFYKKTRGLLSRSVSGIIFIFSF